VNTLEAIKRKHLSTGMDWKKIKVNIENHSKTQSELISILDNKLPRASVLIILFEWEETIYTVLTRRSSKLSSHKGEVCFPGGKSDKDDKNEVETALREANEEIGLNRSCIDIIGKLSPLVSLHGLLVTPVVL